MGRLKAGKQLRTVPAPKEKLDATSKASSSASLPTVPKLFAKAQGLVVQGDFDLARQFLDRILQQEPSHIEAYELLGIVQLELGDLDAARSTFLHLLEMPNTPASAHLYLAQLEDEPQTSLRHYEAAIETFTTQLKGKDTPVVDGREPPTEEELKSSIVQALCAMIEIWMSDLCMEESAEASCEALLSRAFAIDENSPEALQSLASCRISQDRPDDARLAVERSWAQWKDLEPDDSRRPDLPQRLSLAKLFLELAQHYSELALFESALSILQDVLASDDQEVMGWYLEGWCLLLMSDNLRVSAATADGVSWTDLAHDARECLDMCKNLHINQQHPDAQVLQHVEELLAEIVALNLPPRANDDDDDEIWVDDDEDARRELLAEIVALNPPRANDKIWADFDADEDGDVEMS